MTAFKASIHGGSKLDSNQSKALGALLGMQRQSWEQGVASHALLDLGQHELVEVMARDAVTRQTPAGKLASIDDLSIVNGAAAGEAVLWAAQRSGDVALAEAFNRQLRWILHGAPRAEDGALFHMEGTHEVWVDTIYMVVPFLVQAGELEEAAKQLDGHRMRLFDVAAGLYAWRWDEDAGQLTHPLHWGTGNGWVVAGIARALHHLHGRGGDFAVEAAEHARAVIDACLSYRDADGLFHDVVTDPSTFSDANLAQMLAYGVLTGVADEWLPVAYESVGRSLLESASRQVDTYGFVTGVCGAPFFDHQGTSAEAQAFFLLASAAAADLSWRQPHPAVKTP